MADVQVNVKVDAKQADDSLRGLTKQLKDLRVEQSRVVEGSSDWKRLGREINELEGKIGDLGDRFNTLRGSGVERLNSSFGLFREGLVSADFGKAKIALQGIGQAMSAIPVLLIVTGIMKLIENFDKLRNSGGLLGQVFKGIGEIITTVTDAITDFTDWLGITTIESEKLAETQLNNSKALQDAVTERYDTEIRLAKAAGKNTEDLEKKKVMAVRQSLLEQINLKAKAAVMDGELSQEELKNLDELRKALTENYIQEKEMDLKANKEKVERVKKRNEDILKENDSLTRKLEDQQIALIENDRNREEAKLLLDLERAKEDIEKSGAIKAVKYQSLLIAEQTYQKGLADIDKKFRAQAEEEKKKAEEEEQKRLADIAANNKAQEEQALSDLKNLLALRLEVTAQGSEEQLNARLNQLETEKQLELQKYAEGTEERILLEQKFQERKDALQREFRMKQIKEDLDTASNSISALQGLSDTFFAIQQANQKEGSEEAERNAKKQFQINKSLQIGAAVVNGLQSILAITSVPDFTLGIATATRIAAQIALNGATIAKIAAQQYKSSNSGGNNSVQAPRANTPNANTPTPQQATLPGQDGTFIKPDNKVYVLESDITKTQDRVARVGEQAKF
jgi:hypothetical protein